MSTAITTRQTAGTGATVKGSPLTNAEVDTNFINLNVAAQPAGGTAGQILSKIDGTNYNSHWIDNYATQVKLHVKNATGATINKGSVVYISGATGANALISLAQANADSTSATTIGFLESTLATGDSGLAVVTGVIAGIDTSAATEGDPVWLSGTVAGGVVYGIANKPQAPTHIVYLGTVTRAHATVGEIQVHISNGWELDELHDVKITSKANNDILQYESATSLWKNVAPAAARTNLGLAIGTNVQAWDADLDAIAALTGTSGFLKKTAANTWSLDTNTYLTGNQTITVSGDATGSGATAITLTLANSGATAGTYNNVTVNAKGLVTGGSNVSYQPLDADLTAIAGLTGTSGFLKKTAADTWSLDTSTYLTSAVTSVTAGTGLSGGTITSTGTIALANTAVSPGSYTFASITVDAQGRITAASSGTAAGATISDDTSTNATYYPTFATATSGTLTTAKVSSSKLQYNPSSGTLTATAMSASSDESLKTNWRDLRADFLELLAAVKHGTYDRVDAAVTQDGVSAQSLRPVLPNSVTVSADGTLAVNYGNAALVSAIKLAERLLTLEARVNKFIEG